MRHLPRPQAFHFPRHSPHHNPLRRIHDPQPPPRTSQRQQPPTRLKALARLQARLPARLRPYLSPLLSAPLSHVTSFLVLHEITAVVPLVALFGVFHYSDAAWLERWRARVQESEGFKEGVTRWGRYARRKGWVADEEAGQGEHAGLDAEGREGRVSMAGVEGKEVGMGAGGDGGAIDGPVAKPARIVLELATAWAVTKAMLPARIAVSVWATPWFARVAVQPLSVLTRRLVGR